MNEGIFDSGSWPRARVEIIETTQNVPFVAGATHVSYLLIGGGGGGGSGRLDTTPGTANAGSGGSGAGLQYRRRMPLRLFQILKIQQGMTVTIGAGGAGGAARTTTNNGAAGSGGGSSSIAFVFYDRGPTQVGTANNVLNCSGGGAGAGGTTGFSNATATLSNSGQIQGITGGQGSSFVQVGGHSQNNFGTHPFHWIAVAGGSSGNGSGLNAMNWNHGLSTFYMNSLGGPTKAGNDNGPDAVMQAKPLWDFMLTNWKEAPTMEELAWLTAIGGIGGNCASTGAGGNGGAGYRGSGGGGGAGSQNVSSGAGGTGGNGVAVFWWERLV